MGPKNERYGLWAGRPPFVGPRSSVPRREMRNFKFPVTGKGQRPPPNGCAVGPRGLVDPAGRRYARCPRTSSSHSSPRVYNLGRGPTYSAPHRLPATFPIAVTLFALAAFPSLVSASMASIAGSALSFARPVKVIPRLRSAATLRHPVGRRTDPSARHAPARSGLCGPGFKAFFPLPYP